jgi:hypothetical protein
MQQCFVLHLQQTKAKCELLTHHEIQQCVDEVNSQVLDEHSREYWHQIFLQPHWRVITTVGGLWHNLQGVCLYTIPPKS